MNAAAEREQAGLLRIWEDILLMTLLDEAERATIADS